MYDDVSKSVQLLIGKCVGLCLLVSLFACVLAGCAKDARSQPSLPHIASVGSLAISYPDGFPNVWESSVVSPYLPEGMSCVDATLIANDDYSIVIEATVVDDPNNFGIAAVEDYWKELTAAHPKGESDEKFDQQFPGLRAMAEETVVEEPQLVDVNGSRALVVAQTVKGEVRQVFYYIESHAQIVGYVYAVFPYSKYQADPSYFEEIFKSIKIS